MHPIATEWEGDNPSVWRIVISDPVEYAQSGLGAHPDHDAHALTVRNLSPPGVELAYGIECL